MLESIECHFRWSGQIKVVNLFIDNSIFRLHKIKSYWDRKSFHTTLLLPFSFLFGLFFIIRKLLYEKKIVRAEKVDLPVIVVGNITVGGTGKTSTVIWLANYLKRKGLKVGILCSGYGGNNNKYPTQITSASNPYQVGDEAVHIFKRTECLVVSCKHRIKSARFLKQNFALDALICDDGLQHYKLMRDIEIHVVHGVKRFGNEYFLPAGPLREPIKRIKDIDLRIAKGASKSDEYELTYKPNYLYALGAPSKTQPITFFKERKVLAVAGIANPEEFFEILESKGLHTVRKSFPDHHRFRSEDFSGYESLPILMTEKDAVKCKGIVGYDFWSISLEYCLPKAFGDAVLKKLEHFDYG